MGNASSVEPADGDGAQENVVRYGTNYLEGVGDTVEYSGDGNPDINSPISKQGDNEAMEILFQFIPYYGRGDGSNDSIVRSTLMALSIEDIDYRDEYGNTLLLLACQYSCEDLVRIMLNKGADPNATNSSGACSLHFTCYADSASKSIAKILLQNGANPDVAETSYGCTPLHYCAGTGDIEFCKLLISYGAQPQAIDYYSYTAADYARDAEFPECQNFLNSKMQAVSKSLTSLGSANALLSVNTASSGNVTSGSPFVTPGKPEIKIPLEWQVQYDENTKSKYYNNIKTGEVLWEQELTAKLAAEASTPMAKKGTPNASQANLTTIQETDPLVLLSSASRECLIAFFTKHDPTRLTELDSLLDKYKGNERQMLIDLCGQYETDENAELAAFTAKLKELKGVQRNKSIASTPVSLSSNFQLGKSTPIANRGTPAGTPAVGGVSQAEMQQLQQQMQQLQEEMQQRLSAADSQFEEERSQYRVTIADKEGVIAKLESSLEAVTREKQSIENEMENVSASASKLKALEGENHKQAENFIGELQKQLDEKKNELEAVRSELSIEKEKLLSLEHTLSSLQSGEAERVAQEQERAEERAAQQREKDEKHALELREVENTKRRMETKLKTEISTMKMEAEKTEANLISQYDNLRRSKDNEIQELNKDMSERKAKFAQELSSAQMMAEAALKRAEAAEAMQKQMEADIQEARQIKGFNAQLHKDLGREQMARKRLHNEMEDMKGKIRVYVRIRPLSTKEIERNCAEAALKDGKLSVLVKGKDGKKNYDFDQVFAGGDGNSQTEVFRDTKHLMLSVIDGYNVCIFAYGQTGAGKSYTMIGGSDLGDCLKEDGEFSSDAGITPRAVSELFRLLKERHAQVESTVEVQMFQLYRDGVEDLLKAGKKDDGLKRKPKDDHMAAGPPTYKITLAEHSPTGLVHVEGAETCLAETPGDVMKIFARGAKRRTTSSTQMNSESSRSHLICCLTIRLKNRRTQAETIGKLTLVDLAGSERIDKSGAEGDQLKEAQSINKSLSALGDVIAALTSGSKHVPYRNHPLTMLMSDSLGGNAKTLMFVNASPADYNAAETVSSLKFAIRCKDITNAVASGPGAQAAQVSALKKELQKLKKGDGAMGHTASSANMKGGPPGGLGRPTTAAQR